MIYRSQFSSLKWQMMYVESIWSNMYFGEKHIPKLLGFTGTSDTSGVGWSKTQIINVANMFGCLITIRISLVVNIVMYMD